MSFKKQLILLALITGFNYSCDKSTSDEFEEVNGHVETRLLSAISVVSAQDSYENSNVLFLYDGENKLTTVTKDNDTGIFSYDNGELANVTSGGGNLSIEELYQSPYDAFEYGEVMEYDDNGNPYILKFIEERYNYMSGNMEPYYYTAQVTYDDKPNLFYKTMEAGGLIDVMDGVRLNFSIAPQSQDIVKAKALFFNNNPSQIIYKNEEGEVEYVVNISYVYDGDYPTSATVTSAYTDGGETNTYTVSFSYRSN
ncbi:hypothetical protein [Pseudozobellia thermophila]|uniref:DUF4595 domain-containing protein n=1 Tax=Pseudozobellia thermophila TaxID=192903 RepID=A0A1M6BDQ4_9FLAO|nr:hypothetical protein [Pseudozobellia thermophila]SHI46845.1 hypothetical protein SAMN04488513_101379 [Pseudozobellia thermophila]